MQKQKSGHIINVASVFGIKVFAPGGTVYSATKSAVRALTEGLRVELHSENICNHALFNATATILYLVSLVLRLLAGPGDGIAAVIIGFVGLASVIYAAYLGGDLVFTKGTGVNHTAWEAGSEDYEVVMPLEGVEENKLYRVTASGVPVVLLRQGLQFYAISATCPHAGGPLDEGTLM